MGLLKITLLANAVPDEAEALMHLLPHLKITERLLDVGDWTGLTRHFNGVPAEERHLLMTTILADAINLGLSKMPLARTYAKLTWLQAWHIRDKTYAATLAKLVNAQL